MNNNIKGKYRLEGNLLTKEGLTLELKSRRHPRKNQSKRFIGVSEGGSWQKYISGLYPRRKNVFSLDYEGEKLELEVLSETEVLIKEPEARPVENVLMFRGEL